MVAVAGTEPVAVASSTEAYATPTVTVEPQWLRIVAFGAAAAVAAFGAIGLLLAIAGWYHAVLVFPLGLALWAVLMHTARPLLRAPGRSDPTAHALGAIALVFIIGMVVWHAHYAGQHLLIDRDPGSYTNAGHWIATHGSLVVHPRQGPFAQDHNVAFGSFGIKEYANGTLGFSFAHLLPALLAEAHSLGGDSLMFVTAPILAGIALLGFILAAWRLFRNGFVALAATVSFALLIPEVSFSRDTFSEIPTQVLVFAALWLLLGTDALEQPRPLFLAGLLLGLVQAVRIDALSLMLGLPLLFAVVWLRTQPKRRPKVARAAGACAIGLVPGIALGFLDLTTRSTGYFHDLEPEVHELELAMAASVIVAALLVFGVPPLRTKLRIVPDRLARAVGIAIVAVGFFGWFVRPHVMVMRVKNVPTVQGFQRLEHIARDGTRTYYERSLQWMSWYVGPIALAAAIIGAGVLVATLIRGKRGHALAALFLLGPATLMYLWRASAIPDQVWVTRRFLPAALPLIVLLAFWLVGWLGRTVPSRMPRLVPAAAAIVLGVAALAAPVAALTPVNRMTDQRGSLAVVKGICATAGPKAAFVALKSDSNLIDGWVPQTLRNWCDAPTAAMRIPEAGRPQALQVLAQEWKAAGRQLWVISGDRETVAAAVPRATVDDRVIRVRHYLERRLLGRPSKYVPHTFHLVIAPVR